MKKLLFLFGAFLFIQNNLFAQKVTDCFEPSTIEFKTDDFLKNQSYIKYLNNISGRRVIAMGESTHGTQEFQKVKTETFKYLVTKGFNIFGLEANYSEREAVNNYIVNGVGDPTALIKQFQLWPWKTTEIQGLVHWMRNYNIAITHKRKLQFFGFDSGNGIFLGIPALKKLIENDGQTTLEKISSLEKFEIKTKKDRDSIQNEFKLIKANWNSNKNDLIHKVGLYKFNVLINTITTVIQNYEYYYIDLVYLVRDRHMAENIENLVASDSRNKMFVFAHNAHVTFNEHYYERYGRDSIYVATKPMGYYLKKQLKSDYQAIGLDFLSGSFRVNFYNANTKSRTDTTITLSPAPENYLAVQLLKKGKINAAVLSINNHCTNFADTVVLHNYGGGKPGKERSSEKTSFKNGFDAILVFRKTSPTEAVKD